MKLSLIIFIIFLPLSTVFSNDFVEIVEVIDGDTIDVKFSDGTIDRVRFVGIDCPESFKENDPDEYEGINDPDYLYMWALTINKYTTSRLLGKQVILQYDSISGRRGYYGRILAYIIIDDINYNLELVEKGFARAYIEADCELLDELVAAQESAMFSKVGIWSESTVDVDMDSSVRLRIVDVHYNAEGNDNENLNDEYFSIENISDEEIDFTGWRVVDEGENHRFYFPDSFTLSPGETVTIYTGSDTDSDYKLYWNKTGTAVWNNGGDTVHVYNASG